MTIPWPTTSEGSLLTAPTVKPSWPRIASAWARVSPATDGTVTVLGMMWQAQAWETMTSTGESASASAPCAGVELMMTPRSNPAVVE